MLVGVLAFVVSQIPCVFYFFFLKKLKDDPEYKKDCNKTLFRGLGSSVPVFFLDLAVNLILAALNVSERFSPVVNALIKCFVVNAIVEEFVKVSIGKRAIKKNRATVSWLDMISFITISSAGFEILESALYMLSTSPGQILVRGASMMHVSFGLIEGWFNGKYAKTGKKVYQLLAMTLAMLIHGFYNFGLNPAAPEYAGIFSVLSAAASLVFWIYMIFYIRKRKNDPEFTSPVYAEAAPEETAEA